MKTRIPLAAAALAVYSIAGIALDRATSCSTTSRLCELLRNSSTLAWAAAAALAASQVPMGASWLAAVMLTLLAAACTVSLGLPVLMCSMGSPVSGKREARAPLPCLVAMLAALGTGTCTLVFVARLVLRVARTVAA